MATWDGSYTETDEANYCVNSTKNQTPVNMPIWDYYVPDVNNTFIQNNTMTFSTDMPTVFEQSTLNFCNHIDKNIIPPLMTNSEPLISYQRNEIQSFTNQIHVQSSNINGNSINNQLTCFYENNRTLIEKLPSRYNKSNFQNMNMKDKYKHKTYQINNIIENSNLQVTATEFIPNYNKREQGINENLNKNVKRKTYIAYKNQDIQQPLDNSFYEDNKIQDNNKKFENKQFNDRRWRNMKLYKDDKKDCGKNNIRRCQNDKYFYNRNACKKIGNQFEKDDVEVTVDMSANNQQIELLNEHRGRFYDKKERCISRIVKDTKVKKNNYLDYNGHNRKNYSIDKYVKGENKNFLEHNQKKEIIDWRQRTNKSSLLKSVYCKKNEFDDANQRERLTEQLNRGQLECLVCCEFIRQIDYVWSCKNCYHVLHLKCIKKWAQSSKDETGWRCPACQNVTAEVSNYECFCGKIRMPDWNRHDNAHSCGDICGRSRIDVNCTHKCTLLCHPGSCPPCSAIVKRFCGCGRMSQTLKCSANIMLQCQEICERPLNCGIHKCEVKCHHGSCEPCDKIVEQECFCGKHNREQTCILDSSLMYSCKYICDKILDCNNHKCKEICHPGECGQCILKPETVTNCCCGQSVLTVTRKNCMEPIPTCEKICCKSLKCGQPNNPHTCQVNCHNGDCPKCELVTKVKCRCGYMDKEIPCKALISKADDARCEKKCIKKRSCGKHKCNQMCCIDIEHICPLPCSKNLSCGRHKCEKTCHRGRCEPCWRSSFEELYCECGSAVIYPPIACGTRKPVCSKPCSRTHSCDHEIFHSCHSDLNCPPCTVLTQKWCYGDHELRKAVPCYVNEVSCGLPCGKPISCGMHKCIQKCHPDVCEKPGQICIQPCTISRELCGHICAASCHSGKCPDVPCKEMVKVTCQCGHRTMTRVCVENSRDYQRIASGILASKMADVQLGHSIDLEEVFGQGAKKQNQLKTLECNDECKIIERNRRLTLGLQIENPDLCGKLIPKYSEYMRQWAKKDPVFCQMVHEKLTELVQLAKISKQKCRSYSFESMNRDKRHFVHESCEHFGCESQAYDQEPKRNIVATAVKDKCWLPSYSLMELLQRENGQRKVPGPMLNKSKTHSVDRNKDILQLNLKKVIKPSTKTSVSIPRSPESEIDYFNYKG